MSGSEVSAHEHLSTYTFWSVNTCTCARAYEAEKWQNGRKRCRNLRRSLPKDEDVSVCVPATGRNTSTMGAGRHRLQLHVWTMFGEEPCPNLDPDLRSSHSLNIPSLLQLHTINLHSSPGGKKTSSGDVNGVKQITLLCSLLFTPSSQFTCCVSPPTHTSLPGWRLTITVALNNGQLSYHGDFNKTAVSALLFLNLDAVPLSFG